MNKGALTALAYLVLLILSSCSSSVQLCQSNWQDRPVIVNGRATPQWSIPLQYFDNDTKLNYVISNDDTNLYYWIRITDDKEQLRVMRAGMQFWIDTTGKNQQQVGIQFPFSQLAGMQGGGQKNHAASPDTAFKDVKKWTGKLDQMRLSGFKYPIVTGITPIPNIYGIKACILRDSTGVTIYQACVPFKTFYKPVLTSADNNKAMGITVIINPMPVSGHSGGGGHGGGGGAGASGFGNGMHMGGGGMGGGGMGGGMRGGGGRSREEGNEEDENNLKSATLKLQLRLMAK